MTTTTTTLYANEHSGSICCLKHVGMYAQTAIAARPKARRWHTPLGDWTRWTAADEADWVAEFGEPAQCESCRFGH